MDLPKPNDFFLGVTEVFVVLMPGAAAVALLKVAWPALPIERQMDFVGAALAFVLAYIFGNSLRVAGAMIEDLIDHRLLRRGIDARFGVSFACVKSLRGGDDEASTGVNHLKFCRSVLQREDPTAWAEVQRAEVDAKLFRSLVVLDLVAFVLLLLARGPHPPWLVVAAGSAVVTFAGYYRMRWRGVRAALGHYLALHGHIRLSGSTTVKSGTGS